MDQKVSALNTIPAVDRATDYLYIVDVSAGNSSNKVTPNFLLGITGTPVGTTDTQVLTNKTLGNTNLVTLLDGAFTLQNNVDPTKRAIFSVASVSPSTTRTYTLPNASSTLADTSTTQTLTNKTLTSPTINTPTITNATITANAVSGFTTSNSGTIYGVSVVLGTIQSAAFSNQVNTAAIQNGAVTDVKMDYPRWWQEIGRTTLGVAGNTITVASLPARNHLMFVATLLPSGTINASLRFNGDTGANYAYRQSVNGAADTTSVSQTQAYLDGGAIAAVPMYIVGEVLNVTGLEKHIMARTNAGTIGAANAPTRVEWSDKWANTSVQINSVSIMNPNGAGSFAIGSEVIILGHD